MTAQSANRATTLDAGILATGNARPEDAGAPDDVDAAAFAVAKPAHAFCQRVMDLVLGALAALCFLPAALMIALVLATTVGGPLLLREPRVGRHGRIFEGLRFRTMRAGAHQRAGIARLLYLARLDELPLIFTVLRGDMSVVGPRPESPQTVAVLAARLRGYPLRHLVKPGLTGWSQAMGQWRDSDDAARLASDLFYVKNRSPMLDLRILLGTVAVILGGSSGRAG